MWEGFTVIWYTSQFRYKKLWKYQKPTPQWMNSGRHCRQVQRVMWRKWDQSQKSSVMWRKKERQFISRIWWICHLMNAELATHHKIQGASRAPEGHFKTKKDAEQYSQSTVFQRHRWQRQVLHLDTIAKFLGRIGATRVAISAYTHVKKTEVPRLLQVPKVESPEIWNVIFPLRIPESWDNIVDF